MQYATIAAWAADPRTGDAPTPGSPEEAALTRRLEAASDRVDDLLETAIYRHDRVTGLPTDPRLAAVLSSACIEQVLYDDETDPDGSSVAYGPMSLGSLQLPAGGSSGSGGIPGPAPAAWRLIQRAAHDRLLRLDRIG